MKKLLIYSAALFAACASLVSCNKEITENEVASTTHSVSFIAEELDTKTSMTIDGNVATFAWVADDEDNVHIYESANGDSSEGEVIGALDEDTKKMDFTATFSGATAPVGAEYFAHVNDDITVQTPTSSSYDSNADVLVATAVGISPATKAEDRDYDVALTFKRVVAVNKMTIKGLGADETVSSVTITADKDLAGVYSVNEWTKKQTSITITPSSVQADAAGNAVVYFTCLPVEGAQLAIDVTTGEGVNAKSYSKEFASKISFTEGAVKAFGVTVSGTERTIEINVNNSGVTGSYADESFTVNNIEFGFTQWMKNVNIQAKKSTSNSLYNVGAIPGAIKSIKVLQTGTARPIKFYAGKSSDKIDEEIEAPATAAEMTFDFTVDNYSYFRLATPANACYFESIIITYGNPGEVVSRYEIICSETENGTLSADKAKAAAGDVVTLRVSADTEYHFNNDWSVVDANSQPIEVTDGSFVMPASNVTVSGSFSKNLYEISQPVVEHGTYTVKIDDTVVTEASKGDVVSLSATPEEGYLFVRWEVKQTVSGQALSVSKNSFTMPGAAVTVRPVFEEIHPLTTMEDIFAEATEAGNTAVGTYVTFNNWIVSGVKGNNAYVTDGTKGFIVYTSNHGFEVGDILSGTVNCKVQLYKASAELTALTSTTEGLTVTKGGVITPASIAIKDLGGINTGAVFTFTELTYNGTAFTDGTNTITPYNTFITLPALVNGKKYSVTGVYIQFNDTKEIAPRTAEDIVEKAATKYTVSIAEGIENGTVTVDYPEATEGQTVTIRTTPATGYKVKSVSAKKTDSDAAVTVTNNQFIMPAEAVTVTAEFTEESGEFKPVNISWTRNGTSDTVTDGYKLTTRNYSGKTGYYQDGSTTTKLKLTKTDASSALFTTAPATITFKASIGGGTAKDPLDNEVVVYLVDASGNEISGTRVTVTTKVETTSTGTQYTVNIPVVSTAYGVEMAHTKETGYNVRFFGASFSAE